MEFLPSFPTLIAFAAATLLLAATPGPDMTLSISRALAQGKKAALFVVLGTSLGIVVHTMLVAFGISALITASPTAFLILKTGGAAYLFWLAVQAIRYGSKLTVAKVEGPRGTILSNISSGFWVNLLNPKVIIFFMTFLPQFVSAGDPAVTQKIVSERKLTTLMVTHSMRQALDYGHRTIMLHGGEIVLDVSGESRKDLQVEDLIAMFRKMRGQTLDDDALLIG